MFRTFCSEQCSEPTKGLRLIWPRGSKKFSQRCQGKYAHKIGQTEFAIRAARRAMAVMEANEDLKFGPPPIEVDGALLMVEAAYWVLVRDP